MIVVEVICYWAFFGALLFTGTGTPKLFKNKWLAIVVHGPLMWYAAFVAKVIGKLENKDQKDGCVKR